MASPGYAVLSLHWFVEVWASSAEQGEEEPGREEVIISVEP